VIFPESYRLLYERQHVGRAVPDSPDKSRLSKKLALPDRNGGAQIKTRGNSAKLSRLQRRLMKRAKLLAIWCPFHLGESWLIKRLNDAGAFSSG